MLCLNQAVRNFELKGKFLRDFIIQINNRHRQARVVLFLAKSPTEGKQKAAPKVRTGLSFFSVSIQRAHFPHNHISSRSKKNPPFLQWPFLVS